MELIDAGEPPEFLIGGELHTERRMPREHAPAVAVAVDRQRRPPPQVVDRGEADAVEADHHARAAGGDHRVVVLEHPVELVADVEGEHHLAAGAVGELVDDVHHRLHPLGKRRMGRVGHQFIIFDEIDAGFAERADEIGGRGGRQTDARLDDRADDRPIVDAGQPPRARDAELRAGESCVASEAGNSKSNSRSPDR